MTKQDGGKLKLVRSAIAARLADEQDNPLLSIGEGDKTITVRLKPGATSIAQALKREFGEDVEVVVGFKSFPRGQLRNQLSYHEALQTNGLLLPLVLTCEIPKTHLIEGESVTGRVTIQNVGETGIEFFGSVGVGWLCQPGTLVIAGGYSGAVAQINQRVRLDSQDTHEWNFIVGTASCEPNDQFSVKPGPYEVIVPVSLELRESDSTQKSVHLLARNCFVIVD